MLIENPVLLKEMRELLSRLRVRRPYGKRWAFTCILGLLITAPYLYIIYLMFLYNARAQDWEGLWMGLAFLQLFFVCLTAPLIASSAFTLEKEQRTLEMLLLTTLPRRQICLGKLWGRLASVATVLILFLPLMLLCGAMGLVNPIVFAGTYTLLLTTGFALAVLGMASSILFRRTGTAQAIAVLATLGIFVFLPIISALAMEILNIQFWTDSVMIAISPYVALGKLGDTLSMHSVAYNAPPPRNYFAWLPSSGLYAVAALLLLSWLSVKLDRLCREP